MDNDKEIDILDRFKNGYDVVVDGEKAFRNPQVTRAEKKLHCLRATREHLFWGQVGKMKPCSECKGVEWGDWKAYDKLISDIQNKKQVPECVSCWTNEKNGRKSYRTMGNKMWATPGVGNSHTEIIYNNNCDAACLYCTPRHSSRIAKEFSETKHKVPKIINSESALDTLPDNLLEVTLEHVKRVAEDYNQLACIGVYGGEPSKDIIEEDHVGEILRTFYKYNKMWSRTVRYDFNSHFNFSKERAEQLLKYFKKYQEQYPFVTFVIQPSIECMGKFHNFTRYGTEWTTVERNLDYFLKNSSLEIELNAHINNVSLKNLPQFIEHMNNKCKSIRRFSIEVDYVNYPVEFSTRLLDKTFMKYVNDVWYYLENNKPYFINIDDMVVRLKELTVAIDDFPDDAKKNFAANALTMYEYFKKERGIDILEVNPELYYYFKMLNIS